MATFKCNSRAASRFLGFTFPATHERPASHIIHSTVVAALGARGQAPALVGGMVLDKGIRTGGPQVIVTNLLLLLLLLVVVVVLVVNLIMLLTKLA